MRIRLWKREAQTPPELPKEVFDDNSEAIEALCARLRTSGVIPFIGAGISRSFGHPTWREFLLRQGQIAACSGIIEANVAEGRFEEAAEILSKRLGMLGLNEAISSHYGPGRERPSTQGLETVRSLSAFAPGPVVTTNFDTVLWEGFRKHNNAFDGALTGSRVGGAARVLAENLHYLIQLHGDRMEMGDRVLTLSQYRKHYGGRDANTADLSRSLPLILFMLASRCLLFIGCSLVADWPLGILKRFASASGVANHFAICQRPEGDDELAKRAEFLTTHGIVPIWIPTGCYDHIPPLLRSIVRTAKRRQRKPKIVRETVFVEKILESPVSEKRHVIAWSPRRDAFVIRAAEREATLVRLWIPPRFWSAMSELKRAFVSTSVSILQRVRPLTITCHLLAGIVAVITALQFDIESLHTVQWNLWRSQRGWSSLMALSICCGFLIVDTWSESRRLAAMGSNGTDRRRRLLFRRGVAAQWIVILAFLVIPPIAALHVTSFVQKERRRASASAPDRTILSVYESADSARSGPSPENSFAVVTESQKRGSPPSEENESQCSIIAFSELMVSLVTFCLVVALYSEPE